MAFSSRRSYPDCSSGQGTDNSTPQRDLHTALFQLHFHPVGFQPNFAGSVARISLP